MSTVGCGDDGDSGDSGSASGNTSQTGDGGTTDGSAGGDADGAGDGAVTTGSLSEEEFVKRANAACLRQSKDYSTEVTQFLEGSGGREGLTEQEVALAAMKRIVVPITEAQIAAIRRIGAPEGDEEEVKAALAAQEQAIANVMATKELKSPEDLERLVGDATEKLESQSLRHCVFSP